MGALKYEIGKVEMDPQKLLLPEQSPDAGTLHKFIAYQRKELLLLFGGIATTHELLVIRFGLKKYMVHAGGEFAIDAEDDLVFRDVPNSFGPMPPAVASEFAKLLKPRAEERYGRKLHGIKVLPNVGNGDANLQSPFWAGHPELLQNIAQSA